MITHKCNFNLMGNRIQPLAFTAIWGELVFVSGICILCYLYRLYERNKINQRNNYDDPITYIVRP
jgi:hypothetical protein